MDYGMLIDYKWCTGCHACEIACQQVRHLAPEVLGEQGAYGIKIHEIGPFELGDGKFQYEFLPSPTSLCDHCEGRLAEGKKPMCVKHCQTACITVGSVCELACKLDSDHMVLYR